MTDEIVTYLSMTDPSALVWPRVVPAFDFHRVQPADPDRLRGFYHDVGAAYQWRDRLGWSAAGAALPISSAPIWANCRSGRIWSPRTRSTWPA